MWKSMKVVTINWKSEFSLPRLTSHYLYIISAQTIFYLPIGFEWRPDVCVHMKRPNSVVWKRFLHDFRSVETQILILTNIQNNYFGSFQELFHIFLQRCPGSSAWRRVSSLIHERRHLNYSIYGEHQLETHEWPSFTFTRYNRWLRIPTKAPLTLLYMYYGIVSVKQIPYGEDSWFRSPFWNATLIIMGSFLVGGEGVSSKSNGSVVIKVDEKPSRGGLR